MHVMAYPKGYIKVNGPVYHTMNEPKNIPENWEHGIGNRNAKGTQYTKPYYQKDGTAEVRQYTDPNEPHTVILVEDQNTSPTATRKTEEGREKARQLATEVMHKYERGEL